MSKRTEVIRVVLTKINSRNRVKRGFSHEKKYVDITLTEVQHLVLWLDNTVHHGSY